MVVQTDLSGSAGIPVDSSPARRPEPIVLTGQFVTLCPLDCASHGEALYEALHGPEKERLWRYLFEGPFSNRAAFEEALQKFICLKDSLTFAILDRVSGRPVGRASYLAIEPVHRRIEVGYILLSPVLQRTRGATEAMYLMARHAFEDLRYRRYEWKTDVLNHASRRAALRLGFTFEGIFRQHMIIKEHNRDTAWFSMLDSEWPRRKASLEQWLAPSNFDEAGIQKAPLSELSARNTSDT